MNRGAEPAKIALGLLKLTVPLEWAASVAAGLNTDDADDMYGELVIAFDETDQPERASQTLDAINDPFIRASCLRHLAKRIAGTAKLDDGVRLVRMSLDELDAMDRLIDRIDTQAGAAYVMALCREYQAARDLSDTALQDLETLDAHWHGRPLGDIAACAVLADDGTLADRAFALATRDLRDNSDTRPLVAVATRVLGVSGPGEAERITHILATSADLPLAQEIYTLAVRVYLDADDVTRALSIWRTVLHDDRIATLPDVVRTLAGEFQPSPLSTADTR